MTSFWNNRIRFRNYRHTRFSGIDHEMRISFDRDLNPRLSARRNYFALKLFRVKEQWGMFRHPKTHISWKKLQKTKKQWEKNNG